VNPNESCPAEILLLLAPSLESVLSTMIYSAAAIKDNPAAFCLMLEEQHGYLLQATNSLLKDRAKTS
jgi:hypothetical protein